MSTFSSANVTDGNIVLKERTHRIKIKYSMHQYSTRLHNLGNWLMDSENQELLPHSPNYRLPARAEAEWSVKQVIHRQPDDDGTLLVQSPTHQTASHTSHISADMLFDNGKW